MRHSGLRQALSGSGLPWYSILALGLRWEHRPQWARCKHPLRFLTRRPEADRAPKGALEGPVRHLLHPKHIACRQDSVHQCALCGLPSRRQTALRLGKGISGGCTGVSTSLSVDNSKAGRNTVEFSPVMEERRICTESFGLNDEWVRTPGGNQTTALGRRPHKCAGWRSVSIGSWAVPTYCVERVL